MNPVRQEVSDALIEVGRLYSAGLAAYGTEPISVGWSDAASQRFRFAKLAQVLAGVDGPITVNDLGCGYGSLFAHLDEMAGIELAGYHGYDLSESMLERARDFTDGRAQLIPASEPTLLADYSFASGPFNVKRACSHAAWAEYVREALRRLAEKSRFGFAFNLLTTFADDKRDSLFYADPCAFFDFCKREISPYVTLLHDYPLSEWTMLVYHRAAGPAALA